MPTHFKIPVLRLAIYSRPVEACGISPQIKPSLYLCLHFITQARHAGMQVTSPDFLLSVPLSRNLKK